MNPLYTVFRLAWTLFRGHGFSSLSGDGSQKKRRLGKVGGLIMMAILIVYLSFFVATATYGLYNLISIVHLQALLVQVVVGGGVILVFFFGVMYAISVFYYASDIEHLLPLPIHPEQIIGAKFLVTLLYKYIFAGALLLPSMITYGVLEQAGPLFYVRLVLVTLLLPVIPLALATILTMVIMRFTPLARNKDRFNMISGLLVMGLALVFVFASQSMTSLSQTDLQNLFTQGSQNLSTLTSGIFPGTAQLTQALIGDSPVESLTGLLWVVAMDILILFLMTVCGRLLYFKGVIGLNTSFSHRRQPSQADVRAASRQGSPFRTYILKEIRILLRTPIFFMNNILMNFLWPVFLVVPFLIQSDADEGVMSLAGLRTLIAEANLEQNHKLILFVLAAAFGMTCFVATTNGITSSAISREGRLVYIMKMIPMSYTRQLMAKIMTGIIVTAAGIIVIYLLAVILLLPPAWLCGLVLLVLPGSLVLPNLAGIIFELFWPKLHWEDEQKAVKQNLNVVFGMLLSILLTTLIVLPVVLLDISLPIGLLILVGLPWLLNGALYGLIRRLGPTRMRAIDI